MSMLVYIRYGIGGTDQEVSDVLLYCGRIYLNVTSANNNALM